MTKLEPITTPINYSISNNGDVFSTGQTLVGEITGTLSDVIHSDDVNDFLDQLQGSGAQYPPLPAVGDYCEAEQVYNYEGNCIICRQSHTRTIYPIEDTPALFIVYRAGGGVMEWVENEQVQVGYLRTYDGTEYICIQAHVTQSDWTPPAVPALWAVNSTPAGEWATGVAYAVNDLVMYIGLEYVCLQSHTSQAGWTPTAVPALWSQV